MRLDIFKATDAVFRYFFLPDTEVPTTPRFWAALSIITVSYADPYFGGLSLGSDII